MKVRSFYMIVLHILLVLYEYGKYIESSLAQHQDFVLHVFLTRKKKHQKPGLMNARRTRLDLKNRQCLPIFRTFFYLFQCGTSDNPTTLLPTVPVKKGWKTTMPSLVFSPHLWIHNIDNFLCVCSSFI